MAYICIDLFIANGMKQKQDVVELCGVVDVKPLTVNRAWQGRRFRSPMYDQYEKDVSIQLAMRPLPKEPYEVEIWFGVSNMNQDIDNGIKPFLDILQNKYGFNDRSILKLILHKCRAEKRKEFVRFSIRHFSEKNNTFAHRPIADHVCLFFSYYSFVFRQLSPCCEEQEREDT